MELHCYKHQLAFLLAFHHLFDYFESFSPQTTFEGTLLWLEYFSLKSISSEADDIKLPMAIQNRSFDKQLIDLRTFTEMIAPMISAVSNGKKNIFCRQILRKSGPQRGKLHLEIGKLGALVRTVRVAAS